MNKNVLHIESIIGTSNAVIQKFGNQVFLVASGLLSKDQSIVLDFSGITNLTSGFCNASVGKLYSVFPKIAKSHIVITNIEKPSIWNDKIEDSIGLALNPEKAKIHDEAILALFE